MNEKEKKAIEWLKNKPEECTNIINASSYIGNKKAYAKERTNFKIVLNLITKLQKENEYWENGFEGELENNRKNTCELLKQDLIIREKDKMIDLMAEWISERCLYIDDYANSCEIIQDSCNKRNNCKDCIKQYFEKQEKEKGE